MSKTTLQQLDIPVDGDVKPVPCEEVMPTAYRHPDAKDLDWLANLIRRCSHSGLILGESREDDEWIELAIWLTEKSGRSPLYAEVGGTCYDVTLGFSKTVTELYRRAQELDLTVIQ